MVWPEQEGSPPGKVHLTIEVFQCQRWSMGHSPDEQILWKERWYPTCRKRGAEPADLKALKDRDIDGGRKKDKKFQKQTVAFKRTDINCLKKKNWSTRKQFSYSNAMDIYDSMIMALLIAGLIFLQYSGSPSSHCTPLLKEFNISWNGIFFLDMDGKKLQYWLSVSRWGTE